MQYVYDDRSALTLHMGLEIQQTNPTIINNMQIIIYHLQNNNNKQPKLLYRDYPFTFIHVSSQRTTL